MGFLSAGAHRGGGGSFAPSTRRRCPLSPPRSVCESCTKRLSLPPPRRALCTRFAHDWRSTRESPGIGENAPAASRIVPTTSSARRARTRQAPRPVGRPRRTILEGHAPYRESHEAIRRERERVDELRETTKETMPPPHEFHRAFWRVHGTPHEHPRTSTRPSRAPHDIPGTPAADASPPEEIARTLHEFP
jgi:hypothetical protein